VEGQRRVHKVFELTGAADELEIVQHLEDIAVGGDHRPAPPVG
jgi:hypothetical protein